MPDREKQDTSEEKGEVTSEMSVTLPTQIPGGERTEGIKKQIGEVAHELIEQNLSPEELHDVIGSEKNNPGMEQAPQTSAQVDNTNPDFDLRKVKSDPLIGQIVDKKYEILEMLGEGGMGRVYKVKHILTGKIQALKILRPHLASKASSIRRFQREAKAASRIDHPNCVAVTDFGNWENMFYMVMEYVSGPSLSRVIRENGRRNSLPVNRALPIFVQICAGLEAAHRQGIIHRDVKSSNVVLISKEGADDFVKILDFGIAKFGPNEGEATLTESGEVFGSPFYMSPEQCLGKDLDTRSDIYSLGCLMYEALSGRVPLEGDNVIATITKQISEIPEPIIFDAEVVRAIGDQLNDIVVFKALAKDPKDRPQTMAALQKHLLAIQSALLDPSLAKKLPKPTRSTQESRPRVSKLFLYSSLALLFSLAVGLGFMAQMHDTSKRDADLRSFAEKTEHDQPIKWVEPSLTRFDEDKEQKLLAELSEFRLLGGMGTQREIKPRLRLASFYLAAGRYDQAKKQLQDAFALATKLQLDKNADTASEMAEAAYGLALCSIQEEGDHPSAICAAYVVKSLELTNDRLVKRPGVVVGRSILDWELLGRAQERVGNRNQALTAYSLVYKLATENKYYLTNSEQVILSVARTSDFYLRRGDFQKASELLDWVLSAWQRNNVNGKVNEYVALNNYGLVKMKQRDWRTALNAFQSVKEDLANNKIVPKEVALKALLNEADCYRKLNEPASMNDCLRKAQKLYATP